MPSFNDWTTGYATILFLLLSGVVFALCKWNYRHAARKAERERAARREMQMADTWPSLPVVRPAYRFDHSDMSEATLTYCPACALLQEVGQDYRDRDSGFYPLPRGVRNYCVEHAPTWSMRAAEENNG